MSSKKTFATGVAIILACALMLFSTEAPAQSERTAKPLPVEVRKDIRIVYQIKTDDWKEGVGKGLLYLQKLTEAYREMGVSPEDRAISAVFHGNAGYWMLNDTAYASFKDSDGDNPNKEIIAALIKKGVSIELCAETMKSHGWQPHDLLPQVRVVVGAYPRIIDLQMRGYAYIRF